MIPFQSHHDVTKLLQVRAFIKRREQLALVAAIELVFYSLHHVAHRGVLDGDGQGRVEQRAGAFMRRAVPWLGRTYRTSADGASDLDRAQAVGLGIDLRRAQAAVPEDHARRFEPELAPDPRRR